MDLVALWPVVNCFDVLECRHTVGFMVSLGYMHCVVCHSVMTIQCYYVFCICINANTNDALCLKCRMFANVVFVCMLLYVSVMTKGHHHA